MTFYSESTFCCQYAVLLNRYTVWLYVYKNIFLKAGSLLVPQPSLISPFYTWKILCVGSPVHSPNISNPQGVLSSWSILPMISSSGRTTNLSCSLFYWLRISPNTRLGPLCLNSSEHHQHEAVVWEALAEGLCWLSRMILLSWPLITNSECSSVVADTSQPLSGPLILPQCFSSLTSTISWLLSPLQLPPLIFSLSLLTPSQNKCLLSAYHL